MKWANVLRGVGNGDTRGREVLEYETQLVCLAIHLEFITRNLLDLLTPHCLGKVCAPFSWLRAHWPFTFKS